MAIIKFILHVIQPLLAYAFLINNCFMKDSTNLIKFRDQSKLQSRFRDNEESETDILPYLTNKYDKYPCVMSVQCGLGGNDALDWTEMLYKMYKVNIYF